MFSSSIIKIIVADDHKLIKEGMINILNSYPNFLVCDEAENGRELIEKCSISKPDLMLVEASMKPISGVEAVEKIRKENNHVKVLFYCYEAEEKYKKKILLIGGNGLVNKYISVQELAFAINTIMSGDYYYINSSESQRINYGKSAIKYSFNGSEDLSKKEREIINLLASGLTSKKIAKKLFVSKRTVDTHRMHILQKFNLRGSAELMKFAFEYVNYSDNN